MGKLGKKARKFAKKNLPSVLKQQRKNKIVYKKRPKNDRKDVAEKEVVKTTELSNGRDSENEVKLSTSLDALFAEDENVMVFDDSDSDGYLSEDPSSETLTGNGNNVYLEGDGDERTLSVQNQKDYEELAKHKKLLEKLKNKDPKFVKFLQSYNKDEMSQNHELYSDDEDEDLLVLDDSAKSTRKVLTCSTISMWSKQVKEEQNESALVSLINAYRAACHFGPEESGPIIQDSETFSNIYTFMLCEGDNIFRALLKLPSPNCKKETLLELKNTSRWKKVKPMIKSYLRSTLFLLKQVTDSEILSFSVSHWRPFIVFFAAFPSLLSRLIQIIVPLWATGGGNLSANSSLVLQDVVSVCGSNYFDVCFSKTYKAYIARCRTMETVDPKHIEFLKDSVVKLCSLDMEKSCTKALVSIQQLANILRHARQKENKEAIRKIYSWQYTRCIAIWVQFIATNVTECDIQSLLYTMIQLINGIAYLFPGPRYLPLRIQCVQWLNKLSSSSGVFIPVASLILDMLEYKVSKEGGGKSKKSINLASNLKLPKFWLKSHNFVDQCVYSAVELLVVHFIHWSYHITFPEVATIPLIRLGKFHEKSTVESLKRVVKRLMEQVKNNVEFVQKKREDVAFSPKDHEYVDLFLQFEKGTLNTPFTQYYKSVIAKAASMMFASPQEAERVKRKKMHDVGNAINLDNKVIELEETRSIAANGDDTNSKGKKRRVVGN
ncbi:protein REBELOTE [Rutidosis leptorrhynchoides]|uniref:protein REBELOTE n=1 Tax=Rutidosis leptorrhynchoides TaxID=125765 RepID=UPI003A99F8ED